MNTNGWVRWAGLALGLQLAACVRMEPPMPDSNRDELAGVPESFVSSVLLAGPDGDGDGLSDDAETSRYRTDPRLADTDRDGLPDGWEAWNGLDPRDDGTIESNNGPAGDLDGDGFDNALEYKLGAPANNPAWSGEELCFGLTHAHPAPQPEMHEATFPAASNGPPESLDAGASGDRPPPTPAP